MVLFTGMHAFVSCVVQPKCSQYWPESGTVAYGNLEVTLAETIPLADYVVRVFSISKVSDGVSSCGSMLL